MLPLPHFEIITRLSVEQAFLLAFDAKPGNLDRLVPMGEWSEGVFCD